MQGSLAQPDESVNFAYLIFVGQAVTGSFNYSEESKEFVKGSFKEYILLNQRLINMTQLYSLETKEQLLLVYITINTDTKC